MEQVVSLEIWHELEGDDRFNEIEMREMLAIGWKLIGSAECRPVVFRMEFFEWLTQGIVRTQSSRVKTTPSQPPLVNDGVKVG